MRPIARPAIRFVPCIPASSSVPALTGPEVVKRLIDAVSSGSFLVISHTTRSEAMDAAVAFWNEHGTPKLTQRTPEQVTGLFDGLDLVEPGVVSCSRWRPEATLQGEPEEVALFGGVARKP
jgi:hypothetical protein